METFELEGTISLTSNYYQYFVVKQIDNTLNSEMCNIHCVLEPNCDYSTFYASYGRCQLGVFTSWNTNYGHYGVLETFIHSNKGKL